MHSRVRSRVPMVSSSEKGWSKTIESGKNRRENDIRSASRIQEPDFQSFSNDLKCSHCSMLLQSWSFHGDFKGFRASVSEVEKYNIASGKTFSTRHFDGIFCIFFISSTSNFTRLGLPRVYLINPRPSCHKSPGCISSTHWPQVRFCSTFSLQAKCLESVPSLASRRTMSDHVEPRDTWSASRSDVQRDG